MYDVAIIGGGPSGTTVGSFLKKYNPNLNVVILERESFPRDHIGESFLPPISRVLNDLGCWDEVEAANFPIKIGATYRWGKRPELWDFQFLPPEQFKDEPRPAKYAGQRTVTAFQVDRSVYDKILLDHAAGLGCEVREQTKVAQVRSEGDRVTGLELGGGEVVTARHYVDASGNSGILRRALDVPCDFPSTLRNIAIYDYWQNTEWAVEIGVGGTRIQVLSLGYGWIWFIPIGPTRTSIGLVVPADFYKQSGKKPEELYRQALADEPMVAALTKNATSEGKLTTTRDWSFLAERHAGENWFLVGEAGGFADPILSAGVSMAHLGGEQCAFTILELDRGKEDSEWLKAEYTHRASERVRIHIRFGDYWYTANEQFKDLKDFTTKLAEDVGLDLSPENAWDWISRGGFIDEETNIGVAGFTIKAVKHFGDFISDLKFDSPIESNNVFDLDLKGAALKDRASYAAGRVGKNKCYVRGKRSLPLSGPFELLVAVLQRERNLPQVLELINAAGRELAAADPSIGPRFFGQVVEAWEAMIRDGWIKASYNPKLPLPTIQGGIPALRWNVDNKAL